MSSPHLHCRSMAAWASSKKPERPSTCATYESLRSTKAPTASRPQTWWAASSVSAVVPQCWSSWPPCAKLKQTWLTPESSSPPSARSWGGNSTPSTKPPCGCCARSSQTPTPYSRVQARTCACGDCARAPGCWRVPPWRPPQPAMLNWPSPSWCWLASTLSKCCRSPPVCWARQRLVPRTCLPWTPGSCPDPAAGF